MKKIIVMATVLLLASTVAACERKDVKPSVKQASLAEVVAKKQPSVLTLEQRVYALEQRNREIDAAVRRKRAAAAKVAQ